MKAFITVALVATLSFTSTVHLADETPTTDSWAVNASNEAEGKGGAAARATQRASPKESLIMNSALKVLALTCASRLAAHRGQIVAYIQNPLRRPDRATRAAIVF